MAKKNNPYSNDIRPLVRRLGKLPGEWQRHDLVEFCLENRIRVINFRYASFGGKLRELRLPVNDRDYLEGILARGERVDGSSLFPGLFKTADSDLYVVPVYRWAFLNPWADDEIDIVCRFADKNGNPCALTPDNLLAGAVAELRAETGVTLTALAELEFYLLLERGNHGFAGKAQRNYHQSTPYLHGREIADEILRVVSEVTGSVKYCHSEVGYIDKLGSEDPEIDGRRVEQYELEFDLMDIEDLACRLTVARWLIRTIASRHGASVTYLPKLDEGMAGSGMHLHLALQRDGNDAMCNQSGELSEDALRLIGGVLGRAKPLTAFGNTVLSSYLRLVPNHEAPTAVCWGYRNRSCLIRVPLNFRTGKRLDQVMNPREQGPYPSTSGRSTVEFRGPDGTAFSYLLLAAVTLAAREGLSSHDRLDLARKLQVERGVVTSEHGFDNLPTSAVAAARELQQARSFFEEGGFPPSLIDLVIEKLEAENDEGLSKKLGELPAAERLEASRRFMHKDLHKH
ncbi:MAG: glutamine synthetase [Acidobacteriota bacterium]|nr:glutamine synthetase [Acidobacteriota bacterium]